MATKARGPQGRCVSVTFRGHLPSEDVLQEVRRHAGLLRRADTVHAVVRAVAPDRVEVHVEATVAGAKAMGTAARRQGSVGIAQDHDVRRAIARAFDKLAVDEEPAALTGLRMALGSPA